MCSGGELTNGASPLRVYPRKLCECSLRDYHRCVYTDRRVLPADQHNIHPAIIRDPAYEHQEEVGAIWESKEGCQRDNDEEWQAGDPVASGPHPGARRRIQGR